MRMYLLVCTFATMSFSLTACGGGEDATDPLCEEAAMVADTDFAWIRDNIFVESCADSDCHGGVNPEEGLDLRANAAHSEIFDKVATQDTNLKLVDPGNADMSYLYIKLGAGNQALRKDEQMPNSRTKLCDPKIDLIKRWINAGAPQ